MPTIDPEEQEISERLYQEGLERQRKRATERDHMIQERDRRRKEDEKRDKREVAFAAQVALRRQEELIKMSSSPIIDAEWREINLCKNN